MAQVKLIARHGLVKIGLTDPPNTEYAAQVIGLTLNSNPQLQNTPATWGVDASQTWTGEQPTLTLRYLQDWSAPAGGLAGFLQANKGKPAFVTAQPTTATTPTFKYPVQLVGPNHLGEAGAAMEDTVVLPVTGDPTLTLPT